MKTMTVRDLTLALANLMAQDKKIGDYKVFLSSDPEGNGYGTVDPQYSFTTNDLDKNFLIYPTVELQYEEIAPKESERIDQQLRDEGIIE